VRDEVWWVILEARSDGKATDGSKATLKKIFAHPEPRPRPASDVKYFREKSSRASAESLDNKR
jgi:hypothetical protein